MVRSLKSDTVIFLPDEYLARNVARETGKHLMLTECSMGDNLAAANPEKEMVRLCSIRCPHMNEITLEETLLCLKHNRYVIEVPEAVRFGARRAVERMLEIG